MPPMWTPMLQDRLSPPTMQMRTCMGHLPTIATTKTFHTGCQIYCKWNGNQNSRNLHWLWFDDNDLTAVLHNIHQSHICWNQIAQLLKCQKSGQKATGHFYLAAVQAILLYRSESWTLMQQQLQILETFHHQRACHIACNPIQLLSNGKWHTPCMADILEQVGHQPIHIYIQNHQDHIPSYTEDLPIFMKCETSAPTPIMACHTYW